VFSRDTLARYPDLIYREPRIRQQAMQRWSTPDFGVFQDANLAPTPAAKSHFKRDWEVTPLGGHLLENSFPAKFSFNPALPPDCTNDYVVFGLNTVGVTGHAANLVAFNNLYSGSGPGKCGAVPTALFAYNTTTVTGGKVVTSPVLSLDGSKIAFVESIPGPTGSSVFHVLTWVAGGAIGASVAPGASMISLALPASMTDTGSSPWVDYDSDTAYVGTNNGKVYKITGVFNGVPAIVVTSPWPVLVSTNMHLTPPVLDSHLGMLMVGSADGNLYQINIATGAVASSLVGAGFASGIVAPPIVDVTNGTTFVVDSNNGANAVLVEFDTASLTPLASASLGEGAFSMTAIHLYQPAFSNAYYTQASTGVVSVCGTGLADTTPWMYVFGFTVRTLLTAPSFSQQLLTSTVAQCTGWTEFFNPSINGGTDFFFVGLTQDCPTTGAANGCVAEFTGEQFTLLPPQAPLTVIVDGGPSGIVVDNYSTASQASSIYLTATKASAAYKFTQAGLN